MCRFADRLIDFTDDRTLVSAIIAVVFKRLDTNGHLEEHSLLDCSNVNEIENEEKAVGITAPF